MQRLSGLIEWLIETDHHVRRAVNVDITLNRFREDPARRGDLDFPFVVFHIGWDIKVYCRETFRISARGLLQHDVGPIASFKFELRLDVYSRDGPGCLRMRGLDAQAKWGARLGGFSGRQINGEGVRRDFREGLDRV